jgi:hypothetical protein
VRKCPLCEAEVTAPPSKHESRCACGATLMESLCLSCGKPLFTEQYGGVRSGPWGSTHMNAECGSVKLGPEPEDFR